MLLHQDLSFSKTLNPNFSPFPLHPKSLSLTLKTQFFSTTLSFSSQNPHFSRQNAALPRDTRSFAGRSKKEPGGPSPGRAGGYRRPKGKARIRSVNIEESPYFRLKSSNKNHPNNLTEDQLNQIGLGYDYMARFMDKEDPNLKHPHDWYRYGEYGPYSWRGVVVGEPVLGGITDECVTLYSEVKDDAEWDKIEQHEMAVDFGERLKEMNKEGGFRHFWVFVRHPRWKLNEKPWEQWTLVSEVVVEAGKQKRLDKWNLMGRLGNQARKLITRCAAWFRPDIIYVKRPVFQCRFEPQDEFFKGLVPFLDPETERDFLFEVENEDGSVQLCTYYEGLCKIVKVSQKAFVDDVVKAYEKMSEERKSVCLEFLLTNHPVQLLHPYTKEWKAKLEEMELGCDAPDDDDEYGENETEYTEWVEDDGVGDDRDDVVLDMEEGGVDDDDEDEDDGSGNGESISEEDDEEEENEQYWEKKFKKALSSSEEMENLVKWSVDKTDERYKKQWKAMQGEEEEKSEGDGDETVLRGVRAKVSPSEWKIAGIGRWGRRIKKAKMPPGLFLRAAVRPFKYRNLVKEIALTRHAILDGDIGRKE